MKQPMARVRIVGLKAQLLPAIRALHELGCVQIDARLNDDIARVAPLRLDPQTIHTQEELAYLATRCDSLLSLLDPHGDVPPTSAAAEDEDCLEAARQRLGSVATQAQTLAQRREALQAERAALPRYEKTLRKLSPLVPAQARAADSASMVVLVNRSQRWVLDKAAQQVRDLVGEQAEMVEEDVSDEMRAMLIVAPRAQIAALEQLLGQGNIARMELPEAYAGQPPDVAVAALTQRLAAIPKELAEVESHLAALAQIWAPRLQRWRRCLHNRLDEINVLPRLGETDYTFVLLGWTPRHEVARVQAALGEVMETAVLVESLPLSQAEKEAAPVALVNPALARPFQSLVRLLAFPSYGDIDPTPLMAVFLPLFFGMILGDVGYGLLLLAGGLLGLRRVRRPGVLRDLLQILTFGAGWAIFFGLLYGETFATLGEKMGQHALWLPRTDPRNILALLIFALAVGAAHVTLGLGIGVWEAWRQRSRSHLLERGGMLVGLSGLFLATTVLVNWLPRGLMTPALALTMVGIVLLGASHGWLGVLLGPLEFIGLLGNILSYLRIAAVGLASVYVAMVANELAGGLGSLIVGVLVAVLIHALNLVLGAFSPTIHSLRLHYVEFFRKFYTGGGRPFEPFRVRGASSE